MEQTLQVFINGKEVIVENPNPEWTLLQFLRDHQGLTGTKLGCGEGGCGACTVMISHVDPVSKKIVHRSANACLTPACGVDGMAVITIEGIGDEKKLHPVQERLAKAHGSQCGFCTPGIIMSMYALLRNNPNPTMLEIEENFDGNLCRCTGYRPILSAYHTFAKDYNKGCGKANCCQTTGESCKPLFDIGSFSSYAPSQDIIFPPKLLMQKQQYPLISKTFSSNRCTWFNASNLTEIIEFKSEHPDAKIIVGNTEVAIEMKVQKRHYPYVINASQVPELFANQVESDGVRVGASTTLSNVKEFLEAEIKNHKNSEVHNFNAVLEALRWFAGHQVRNMASLAGNIATASPISDINPVLVASGAQIRLNSKSEGVRDVFAKDFFVGYRKTVMKPDEVIVSVFIPFTKGNEFTWCLKQARRREDDIAIVNTCMRVELNSENNTVNQITMAYGGLAPTTARASTAEQFLVGKKWEKSIISETCDKILDDFKLDISTPGGMPEYRMTLAISFFYKFFHATCQALNLSEDFDASVLDDRHKPVSESVQTYDSITPTETQSVGTNAKHTSAIQQAVGRARYTDDIPKYQGELYAGLVLSKHAHAKITKLDPTDALKMPGVVDFVCWKDVPGENIFTTVVEMDEECFPKDTVMYVNQIIGLVLATSKDEADQAAVAVKVEYEVLDPIITIEDAIEKKSFYPALSEASDGNVEEALKSAPHVLEGSVRVGGQEQFYLETQACICVPKGEHGEMEVLSSTQNLNITQAVVARVLGVPRNRVLARVKRIGGGFGGKETRSIYLSSVIAVAAQKVGRPVRCMLDRQVDMTTSGGRHPFLAKFKVGFNDDGKLLAGDFNLYNNAGASLDLSNSVLFKAFLSIQNAYHIEHIRVNGYACKTHLPPNTAFRGFGAPQGMAVIEEIVDRVAARLEKPTHIVRELNLEHEGDISFYGQKAERTTIRECWEKCKVISNYDTRLKEVEEFNSKNRWRKRGVALLPTKFSVAFGATFLNQGSATVHIYTDASVLVSHGGVEMGQGINIKVCQVAADALGVPLAQVFISESSTASTANQSPTAASMSADLYGMAVLDACQQIMKRLEPFMKDGKTFKDAVNAAYFSRVCLSAHGFHKVPDIHFDMKTMKGRPYSYYTFGVACAEVEIDTLSGDSSVRATHIVMDVGSPLNPAIDIGQIEGGFVQGLGLFTLEEKVYRPSGHDLTFGPGNYKIPGFRDIPTNFEVHLLRDAPNPAAVHSSKAIGEPPLFLGAVVFFAIKEAIRAARLERKFASEFNMDTPATSERIRLACEDEFTAVVVKRHNSSGKPFAVRA